MKRIPGGAAGIRRPRSAPSAAPAGPTENEESTQPNGYLVTLLPVGLGAIGLLSFARWNMSTALVIVKTLNLSSILLVYSYLLLGPLAFLGCLWYVMSERLLARKFRYTLLLIAATGALLFVSQPFDLARPYMIGLVLATPAAGLMRWLIQRHHRPAAGTRRVVGGYFTAIVVVIAAAIRFPWLPLEIVVTEDGRRMSGWVLESGDHDLTFMRRDSDIAEIIRQDDIVSRTLCEGKREGERGHYPGLVLLLDPGRRSALPPC